MRTLFFIFIPILTFAQNYTLENIGDNNLFNHFSPVYEYPNSENIIILKRKNEIGLFRYTDSSKTQQLMQRYYETGMISMIITNLNFKLKSNDSVFVYCTSGKVKTFYPNGRLRNEYTLDSLGDVEDEIKQYTENGTKLESIRFKHGKVYEGAYIEKWSSGYYFCFYKNGRIKKEYYLNLGIWYKVENRNVKSKIRGKYQLRKFKQDYSLEEEFALIFPMDTNR
jgi:antitoxin component YwqK of YwqJK toxin-antitoxin module